MWLLLVPDTWLIVGTEFMGNLEFFRFLICVPALQVIFTLTKFFQVEDDDDGTLDYIKFLWSAEI